MTRGDSARKDAEAIWKEGVRAVHAGNLVRAAVRVRGNTLHAGRHTVALDGVGVIRVVGAGKAGRAMASALESALGPRVLEAASLEGWVNVPKDQAGNLRRIVLHGARSTHDNTPTSAGVRGARRMLEMVRDLRSRDLVLCLISGGGSALWPHPAGDVTVANLVRVTGQLAAAGATINELNAVRGHLSLVKGGGLIRATRARIVSLIVSDVVGDPPHVIASGPTAPDPTTYADALEILERYGLLKQAPARVVDHLWAGARGTYPETWKKAASRVRNVVIGNSAAALAAAAREARRRGYRVVNLSSYLEGESREAGAMLAAIAVGARETGAPAAAPLCILSGGETTVTLGSRPGKGGRNQELVLGALSHLQERGIQGITVLSGGTDGEDGPTDAAGAVADAAVLRNAQQKGLPLAEHLERHDAYRFFDASRGLFRTGPTHTNVMDLRVVLVRES
jgi:hydroxypyruvate reductase/glycerate 2-kinase